MSQPTSLGLTDQQFTTLMDAAAQLYPLDRDPFLRAVAERFAGRGEIGEGEFGRALRAVLSSGRFKWTPSRTWSGTHPAAPIV